MSRYFVILNIFVGFWYVAIILVSGLKSERVFGFACKFMSG